MHRYILNFIGLKEYSKEENLNLLSENNLKNLIKKLKKNDFIIKIFKIRLFGFTSNLIILGTHKDI
jgi:UV DNA damage repair endonuclease